MSFNIRLFPTYMTLIRLDFWMPVFFLYFLTLFDLNRVLQLEAIYYAAVVLLEVPSGYVSDRFGRKITLVIASIAGAFSGLIFATNNTFGWFVAAQILYAVFMAFNSGSDTSLLYDSLKSEGREKEILAIEADAHSKAFFFGAIASVVAGLAAYYGGFRAAYFLSGIAYSAAALIVCRFTEPPQTGKAPESNFFDQIGTCFAALRNQALLWVFLYYVGRTIFEHIPYEFFQPYVKTIVPPAWLAIISGTHLAVTKLFSSAMANKAKKIVERWGTTAVLLFTNTVITALILIMGLWFHPIVLVLLLARNVAHGLGESVMNAAIHPRIDSGIRATYLSLQSLAGRLSFAGTLALIALFSGDDSEPRILSKILLTMGAFSIAWVIGLKMAIPKELEDTN